MDTSPFGKVVAIILTAVLIFLFPLPYVAKAVRETVDDLVNVYVAEFSDTARQQGVITKEMYENLTRSLNRTGELYDINLEVLHPVSGTEIAEIELGDDIPALSTETVSYSESTLNKVAGADDEIQSFATHTHTNDCYAGHRHNSSCTYTYTMPAEGVSANMLRGDLTRYSYLQLVDARSNPWRITELRHDYNTNIFSVKENVGSAVNFYAEFRLGEPLYYNNLNQLYKALQWIEAGSGQSLQLDRNTGFFIYPGWLPALSFSSCTLSQDEMSICKQVVTSMAATSPTQTVKQGDSIVTTAMATYLDGSTGVVNCNSNFNTNQVGTQTVTLTYNGLVGDAKTTGTRTCTITVSVTPKHTHTNNCYAGHRHSDALCYDTLNFGRQMWYWKGNDTRYQFSVEEYNYPGNSYGKNIKMTCGNCGRGYNLVRYVVMTNGSNLSFVQLDQIYFITNTDTLFYRFSVNSDLPNYNSAKVSFDSIVTSITNGESSEGIKEKLRQLDYIPNVACYYCGGQNSISPAIQYVNHGVTFYACDKSTQDTTPICNQVVTSITAKKTVQTVSTKGEFVSTANATYLDEHTGVVNCSNNLNINVVGEQTVTLTYSGLVGNAKTTGTRTCTVNTTVKGLIELTDITVSPLNQDVTRYQNPTFIVTAKYNNNTSKQVTGFSINGYNSTLLGEQTVTLSYKEADITKTATANVTVKNLTTTCPNCNKVYYLDENDIDQGCPNCNSTVIGLTVSPDYVVLYQGDLLHITVEAEYANGKRSIITDWTSNYDPSQVGIQDVTITYQTFTAVISVDVRYALHICSICSLKYELNIDGTDPGCPACSSTVVSIEATPAEIAIEKHQSLPITVTATYKDGHTGIVHDWASNLLSDTAGIYEVMILYQNAIDIIKVTILEEGQIECPYCGLKYIFNDSPKGCPSCYVTLTGIEAALRSGGTTVPYRSKLNLQITKIFKDEHQELTYTGWTVSDYNPGRLGSQTITVYYGGFQDQLDIEVVDDLPEVNCPNGHTYYLNADGSDPGCPYCNSTEGKAEGLVYFDTTYTSFILDQIYNHGAYPLEKGDYIKITIKPRKVSILSRLLNLFSGFVKKEYTFGGEVS